MILEIESSTAPTIEVTIGDGGTTQLSTMSTNSFSVIIPGPQGAQGIQGIQGIQGPPGSIDNLPDNYIGPEKLTFDPATQTELNDGLALKAPIASPTFTGTVSGITKAMVGLANVDNTTDLLKPISTATQSALDLKAPLASPTFTGTVSGITKTMVGLANVDNTSDANKPVSTAQQTALNLKANLASPTFTGTVAGITKSMVGLANVDNTSDAAKPVSTAQQTALDLKANLASPTFTGTVSGITKTMVGLANVDNTSDANKPVSTAQQTALNLKGNLSGGNSWTGAQTFNSSAVGQIPVVIKGFAGQTGNFLELQASDNSILFSLSSAGLISLPNATGFRFAGGGQLTSGPAGLSVQATPGGVNATAFIVKGIPSHAGNLLDLQTNDGTTVTTVANISSTGAATFPSALIGTGGLTSNGTIFANNALFGKGISMINGTTGRTGYIAFDAFTGDPGTRRGYVGFATNTGPLLYVSENAAGHKFEGGGVFVNARTGQTEDLQGWYNLDGSTQFAAIDSGGGFFAKGGYFGVRTAFATLSVTTQGTNSVGVGIRGVSGQTADLTQWSNNAGTTLALVTSAGNIHDSSGRVYSPGNLPIISGGLYGDSGFGSSTITTLNQGLRTGFYNGDNIVGAPTTSWFYVMVQAHKFTSNWQRQIVWDMTGGTNKSYTRYINGTDPTVPANWSQWTDIDGWIQNNNQTGTAYTITSIDTGFDVMRTNAAANTITVPPDSGAAIPIGSIVGIIQWGAGQTTVVAGAGVTIRSKNGLKLSGQYASATIKKMGANEWLLTGDTAV